MSATTEELGEGSVSQTSLDAPPEHAGVFQSAEEDLKLDRGRYGPTEEELEETPVEEPTEEEETSSEEVSPEGAQKPPEDDDVSKKLQLLEWIMKNPTEFAKIQGLKVESQVAPPPTKDEYSDLVPKPVANKTVEEMGDQELFEYAVGQKIHEAFSKVLPKFAQDISLVKEFKQTFETTVMKHSQGPDGKLLHPRWDELQPTMREVRDRYPNMPLQEAYILADRMVPDAVIARGNEPPPPRLEAPKPPVRKATPAATKAAMLSSLGRSTQAVGAGVPKDIRAAVELAMNEIGVVE